jgi:hypothetical protein
MTATAAPAHAPSVRGAVVPLVAAGLAGGAVDGLYATGLSLIRGGSALRPWQGVASGWIGRAARDGGAASAVLGLATHVAIALCMAAAFAAVASRLRVLYQRPLVSGALYGLILYLVMYRIVLPLRWPTVFPKWDGWISVADIASHVGVGLAIATVLSRYAGASRRR